MKNQDGLKNDNNNLKKGSGLWATDTAARVKAREERENRLRKRFCTRETGITK